VITDLVQIRRLGEHQRERNLRFRKWMKSHTYVERQFRKAAQEVEESIDCRQCAECCRVTEVKLAGRDVAKLARFLRISEREFLEKHTALDDQGAPILVRVKAAGGSHACEFLQGNDCSVYEARPANCERFPHLLRGAGSLESRMWDFVDRATYCPIVYNWMEAVKALTRFRG
jgi:Fe-S-cluster containining protein